MARWPTPFLGGFVEKTWTNFGAVCLELNGLEAAFIEELRGTGQEMELNEDFF